MRTIGQIGRMGVALGLRPAGLFTGQADRRGARHGLGLHGPHRGAPPRRGASRAGTCDLPSDGPLVPTHAAFLPRLSAVEPGPAGHRLGLHRVHRAVAVQMWRGKGGLWKGRAQAIAS
ncbi:MAG: hypothetical protein WDN45_02540 [Caulobacteraceae bacterium]